MKVFSLCFSRISTFDKRALSAHFKETIGKVVKYRDLETEGKVEKKSGKVKEK